MSDQPCPHAGYDPTTPDDCPICLRERVAKLERLLEKERGYSNVIESLLERNYSGEIGIRAQLAQKEERVAELEAALRKISYRFNGNDMYYQIGNIAEKALKIGGEE